MIFTLLAGIGTALFGGGLLGSILTGALVTGAKLLLNSYLNRSKQRAYSAVQGDSQIGGSVAASTVYGAAKISSPHRLFYAKYGDGNKYNAEVFRLAHGWCDGLEPYVYFYGQKHDLVARDIIGGEVAHYGVDGFDDLISIRFYDGRPGQVADAKLVADTAALPQNWKSTSTCTGMTYVVVDRQWDADKFSQGRPNIEFVLRGLREYDPRHDSTVAGGSGPQRLDDPSTWVYTSNPAVHRLNYQLGLRGRVSGRVLIGEGKTLGQLDLSSYFVAMNVCDSLRNGKALYSCGLWVTSDDDHTEILKEFDDAMAGYGLNRRGLSGVLPGAPQVPVFDLTGDDIAIGRSQKVQFRKSAFDIYNQLSGQFTSIDKMWEADSLTPIVVNADIAADGRARGTSNDFLQVTDPDIAQYLLTIRYRQNRKSGSATVPVSRRAGLAAMEGEWITFSDRTWIISKSSSDDQDRWTWELSETGADIYDDEAIDPGPIVVPSPPQINPSLLSVVQNFNVEAGTQAGASGEQAPVLRFTWDPPGDPTITQVRCFYVQGDNPAVGTVYEAISTDPESGVLVTDKNVRSAVFYTARATITTVPDRFKTYTAWKTTATATTPVVVYPPGLTAQINDNLAAGLAPLQAVNLRDQFETARNIARSALNQDAGQYVDKQTTVTEQQATFQTITADYKQEVQTFAGPSSALSQSVTSLSARLGGKADITALVSIGLVATDVDGNINAVGSLVSGIQATLPGKADITALQSFGIVATDAGGNISGAGTAISGLQATVGNFSASGLFRTAVTATEAGASSTIGIYAAATGGEGTGRQAAILMSAITGNKSMIGLVADLVYMTDGAGNKAYPFVFSGGTARLENVVVGTLKFNQLSSNNNKLILRGSGSYADIRGFV